jgi:hypothetical protein
MATEFEGYHGVFGFFKKQGELPRRVLATASAANARRDLFPIRHVFIAL